MPLRPSGPYAAAMHRFGKPPSAEDIEAIARATLRDLPAPFAGTLGDIVLLGEERSIRLYFRITA